MLYITQLIYVIEGQESVFNDFEARAIPIIEKYNGELMLRIRPDAGSYIDASIEPPYEIHLVRFASESDFSEFKADPERKQYLHLKEKSIRESFLIKGEKV